MYVCVCLRSAEAWAWPVPGPICGPSRQMSGDFSNGLGRQKRNEFSNDRAGLFKKEDE